MSWFIHLRSLYFLSA